MGSSQGKRAFFGSPEYMLLEIISQYDYGVFIEIYKSSETFILEFFGGGGGATAPSPPSSDGPSKWLHPRCAKAHNYFGQGLR